MDSISAVPKNLVPGSDVEPPGLVEVDAVFAVAEMHTADPDLALVAKSNCGVPEFIEGKLWYPTSSDDMTAYAELALDAGARIIGACCGSVPDHISQIRQVADSYRPRASVDLTEVEPRLGAVSRPAQRERRRRRTA